MTRARAGFRRAMHGAALGLAALIFTSAALDHADARKRKHRYNPPYAAIVVDANTGKVLHESHADSTRYPASLTKVMTLFLLFERLEAGTIKLSTPLPVSKHAAAQAPSKLALKPGDTISVEDAIGAIVTKSANDVAVVVAEALGGTESGFARMMTRKARILGMNHTTYVNASGLPDTEQRTTARDQARLGRAIQERFPKYYKYFQTRSFTWHGRKMRNHNKLLGRVEGVDGIKTGFTRASGFNLLTSVHRDGRYIVAAVFGGRSGRWRDTRMRNLLAKYVERGSKQRTIPRLDAVALMKRENKAEPATMRTAAAVPVPIPTAAPDARPAPKPLKPEVLPEPATGSTAPIKPNAVKTVKVKAAHMRALGPGLDGAGKMLPPDKPEKLTTVKTVKADIPAPPMRPGMLGSLPAKALEAQNSVPDSMPVPAEPAVKHSGDYLIQVGAFDDVDQARHRLKAARTKAKDALDKADPFTEPVAKGDKTLYRARFAGFVDRKHAEAACKSLRRGEIPCMLLKN